MAHLDHFCTLVGPKPPDQRTVEQDPTAADLAKLIAPDAASMLADALQNACGVWWDQFDANVLAPLKERLKELKAEQKTCEQQLEANPELAPERSPGPQGSYQGAQSRCEGTDSPHQGQDGPGQVAFASSSRAGAARNRRPGAAGWPSSRCSTGSPASTIAALPRRRSPSSSPRNRSMPPTSTTASG